jgi:Na+/melibiose symporter-like transporter
MVSTYLPVHIGELAGPIVVGAMIGGEGLFGILVPLWIGSWSDEVRTRWGGRLPFILAATPIAALTVALMPFARSVLVISLLLAAFYVSYFTYYTPYLALYADLVPPSQRGRSQGIQTAWREVGLGAAMLSGGLLLSISKPLPFIVAAAALVASTGLFLLWEVRRRKPNRGEHSNHGEHTVSSVWSGPASTIVQRFQAVQDAKRLLREIPAMRWLLLANALWETALGALKTFVVLYITIGLGASLSHASGVLGLVAASAIVAALVGGFLADRWGALGLMRVSVWIYGLGLLFGVFIASMVLLVILPLIVFAATVLMTLPYAIMMGMLKSGNHGTASGLFGLTRAMGTLAGPVVAGLAVYFLAPVFPATHGYAAAFLVASVAVLASLPPLDKLRRVALLHGQKL